MKILNPIESKTVPGGVNNPRHNNLDIALKEGLLSMLVAVALVAYALGYPPFAIAIGVGIGIVAVPLVEAALILIFQ